MLETKRFEDEYIGAVTPLTSEFAMIESILVIVSLC